MILPSSRWNDVAVRFREMADDMRFHYILSYAPLNESYDGHFRKLAVKVHRPGLEVRTRHGCLSPSSASA